MRRWLGAGLLLMTGCASPPPMAYILDVTSPECEYIVASVDGQKPERMKGGYWNPATVVPHVMVTPGTHTFVLQEGWNPNPSQPTITVSATLEAGKNYLLAQQGADVTIVENTDE